MSFLKTESHFAHALTERAAIFCTGVFL